MTPLDLIAKRIPDAAIRAHAAAMTLTLAVTDDELVTAQTGLFGRGGKVRRYPLSKVTNVRYVEDANADLLSIDFQSDEGLTLMFRPNTRTDAERIARLLQDRLRETAL